MNGKLIYPNMKITCNSSNLIYILYCNNCFAFYVGETQNRLRLRVNLHRQHVETHYGRFNQLARHLKDCYSSFKKLPKFKMFPFYCNQQMTTLVRRKIEGYFINLLEPPLNK